MSRILFTLASLAMILMIAALVLGLTIDDLYDHPSSVTLNWATVHRLTGVAAALAVVFVESIVVTYFIGTSRWCKEVSETYGLDRSAVVASNRLKRRTFPWALGGMLAVVGVIALGAAADPGTGRPNTADWANVHLFGALAGIAFIGWSFVAAWNNVEANHAIIEGIVADVARIRRERGLEDSPPSIAPPPSPRPPTMR
jgi:hypothetical protein